VGVIVLIINDFRLFFLCRRTKAFPLPAFLFLLLFPSFFIAFLSKAAVMFIIIISGRTIRARAINRLILAFVSVIFVVLLFILILFAGFPVFFGFVSI
jgi:hypothetical protein